MALGNPALVDVDTTIADWRVHCDAGNVFAIIDACDRPHVPSKCREIGSSRAVSLYRSAREVNKESDPVSSGPLGQAEQFAHVAPYIFHLDGVLFDWVCEARTWSSAWGLLIFSRSDLQALRSHFRRFLQVVGPDDKRYLLRFYDPRVLPGFLDASTPDELDAFIGPAAAFGLPAGDRVTLIRRR